jgi:hypothetical protein
MSDLAHVVGEAAAKTHAKEGRFPLQPGIKRCKQCLGTIPVPRRRYCSTFCANEGKLALQTWRRRRARGR